MDIVPWLVPVPRLVPVPLSVTTGASFFLSQPLVYLGASGIALNLLNDWCLLLTSGQASLSSSSCPGLLWTLWIGCPICPGWSPVSVGPRLVMVPGWSLNPDWSGLILCKASQAQGKESLMHPSNPIQNQNFPH